MRRLLVILALCSSAWAQYQPPASSSSGFPSICTVVSLAAQSATISATAMQCGGVQAPLGVYRVHVFARTTSGQNGTGNINALVSWHAPSGAQSFDQNGGSINGAVNGGAHQALSAGNHSLAAGFGLAGIFAHDGTTDIKYSVTYASSGQYDLTIVLERLQ